MCYPLRKKISVSLLTTFIFLLTAFQSANASGIPYTFNQKILQGKVIQSGAAWVYERYNADESLPALQREAQEQKRGLWADANPVPPWEWRIRN
ncbi:thermonuclease family protein [Escherichia coli]|nr:thermonuclease family protein [Escherichia coli]